MSGDLEDFLRRAAQRRQAKAAQAAGSQPRPKPRPQYSDSRTERVVRTVDANEAHDEVLTAEIVEEDPDSIADRLKRIEKAKAEAARAQAEAAAKIKKLAGKTKSSGAAAVALTGNTNADLIAALRNPTGLRQAILLREILQRPTHRWENSEE